MQFISDQIIPNIMARFRHGSSRGFIHHNTGGFIYIEKRAIIYELYTQTNLGRDISMVSGFRILSIKLMDCTFPITGIIK
jgi:hypothetical protein